MSRILIYDSGVGNLPITWAIKNYVSAGELHLLSDTAFFPYGEKTDAELLTRTKLVLDKAIEQIDPDILVIACNTLSTIALDEVRKAYTMPVVGVVPAIKPAANASITKVIGLLATPATINRQYTDTLIEEFAADCKVIKVGSTALVEMAEQYIRDNSINLDELAIILEPLTEAVQTSGLDQVVLGCTHFPLLKTHIQELMTGVGIQDSSEAIGRQVSRLNSEADISTSKLITYHYKTLSTGMLLAC